MTSLDTNRDHEFKAELHYFRGDNVKLCDICMQPESSHRVDINSKEPGICCAWCGVKLTREAVRAFNGSMSCDSCGPDEAEVEITCTNPECIKYRKAIYKK